MLQGVGCAPFKQRIAVRLLGPASPPVPSISGTGWSTKDLLRVGVMGAMGFPRDGCIAAHPRGVFRLRIVCVDACPELIGRYESAMAEVPPNKVTRVGKVGCTEVTAYSKHWPCLFPAWARPEA
jgi:hypothetical protein